MKINTGGVVLGIVAMFCLTILILAGMVAMMVVAVCAAIIVVQLKK